MTSDKNILVAFLLNALFAIVELIGGVLTGSVAIFSDAIHDLGDAVAIGIAYVLERKSKQGPDDTYSYGYQRYSILGSIITTVILLVGSSLVIYHAIERLWHPVPVQYNGMILLAIMGLSVNVIAS
ncbi:cation diffusion facilitator family transporter, partial [Streptococcus pluranimalium]